MKTHNLPANKVRLVMSFTANGCRWLHFDLQTNFFSLNICRAFLHPVFAFLHPLRTNTCCSLLDRTSQPHFSTFPGLVHSLPSQIFVSNPSASTLAFLLLWSPHLCNIRGFIILLDWICLPIFTVYDYCLIVYRLKYFKNLFDLQISDIHLFKESRIYLQFAMVLNTKLFYKCYTASSKTKLPEASKFI